ncbi:MAG: YCF48-related protein [Ignavibacteriae bacterium]|nr:YCF48-related protein [Ignavibacteriota bacterium]
MVNSKFKLIFNIIFIKRILFFATLLFFACFSLLYSQSGWNKQVYSDKHEEWSIKFVNSNTGYIYGNSKGTILKTTNRGDNWTDISQGLDLFKQSFYKKVSFWSIYFVGNNAGWAIGEYNVSSSFTSPFNRMVLKTTNDGKSWKIILDESKATYHKLYFIDSNIGWILGFGNCFKTTNGGSNWSKQISNIDVNLMDVYFINHSTGWIVGENGIILNTTNGGGNWDKQTSYSNNSLYSVYFVNDYEGWIVGTNGTIINTTNRGNNWIINKISINDDKKLGLYSIYFANSNTGWIAGSGQVSNLIPFYGAIFKTTNKGENWELELRYDTANFYSACFLDAETGWIGGSSKSGMALYKTITGGNVKKELVDENNSNESDNTNNIDHSEMINYYKPEMDRVASEKAKSLHLFTNITKVSSKEYDIIIQKYDYLEVSKNYSISLIGSIFGIDKYKIKLSVISIYEKLYNGSWKFSIKDIEIISDDKLN